MSNHRALPVVKFGPGILAKVLRLNPRTEMTSTALYTKTRHQFVTKTVNFRGIFRGMRCGKARQTKGFKLLS
jgi:hypothetical protein